MALTKEQLSDKNFKMDENNFPACFDFFSDATDGDVHSVLEAFSISNTVYFANKLIEKIGEEQKTNKVQNNQLLVKLLKNCPNNKYIFQELIIINPITKFLTVKDFDVILQNNAIKLRNRNLLPNRLKFCSAITKTKEYQKHNDSAIKHKYYSLKLNKDFNIVQMFSEEFFKDLSSRNIEYLKSFFNEIYLYDLSLFLFNHSFQLSNPLPVNIMRCMTIEKNAQYCDAQKKYLELIIPFIKTYDHQLTTDDYESLLKNGIIMDYLKDKHDEIKGLNPAMYSRLVKTSQFKAYSDMKTYLNENKAPYTSNHVKKIMKTINFGVEVEVLKPNAELAVSVAKILDRNTIEGPGDNDKKSRIYNIIFEKDGKPCKMGIDKDDSLKELDGELVTPKLLYEDLDWLKRILDDLGLEQEKDYLKGKEYLKELADIHVHIDGSIFDSMNKDSLTDLFVNFYLAQDILYKAFQSHNNGYHQKIEKCDFIKQNDKFKYLNLSNLNGGAIYVGNLENHQNRNLGLNYISYFDKGTIEFRIFPTPEKSCGDFTKAAVEFTLAFAAASRLGIKLPDLVIAGQSLKSTMEGYLDAIGLDSAGHKTTRGIILQGLSDDIITEDSKEYKAYQKRQADVKEALKAREK